MTTSNAGGKQVEHAVRTGFIDGWPAYYLLKRFGAKAAERVDLCSASSELVCSKLEGYFGPSIWNEVTGKVVIDFGCGPGFSAIEIARNGACHVIGIDIRQTVLDYATFAAQKAGVSNRCVFAIHTDEMADVILSLDGFEHYSDPEAVLRTMRRLIKDDGRILISFGPTWFHPYGGHLFSVFPWAHLIFTEEALIRWRNDFKSDGATRFHEVEGGLNQMSIRRFKRVLAESDFAVECFELVPIKKLRLLHNRLSQEFLTSTVRCRLLPR